MSELRSSCLRDWHIFAEELRKITGGVTTDDFLTKVRELAGQRTELLEALKEMLCWSGPGTAAEMGCKCETLGDAEKMARAAIAKAEGQQ